MSSELPLDDHMTTSVLGQLYSTVTPILLPPISSFPGPLLDSFASSHDPLIDTGGACEKLFTASTTLRQAGVQLDSITRTLSRASTNPSISTLLPTNTTTISHEDIKKARLRARLQAQSSHPTTTRAQILRHAAGRKEVFEMQMKQEEEEALREFKRGLREVVAMGTRGGGLM